MNGGDTSTPAARRRGGRIAIDGFTGGRLRHPARAGSGGGSGRWPAAPSRWARFGAAPALSTTCLVGNASTEFAPACRAHPWVLAGRRCPSLPREGGRRAPSPCCPARASARPRGAASPPRSPSGRREATRRAAAAGNLRPAGPRKPRGPAHSPRRRRAHRVAWRARRGHQPEPSAPEYDSPVWCRAGPAAAAPTTAGPGRPREGGGCASCRGQLRLTARWSPTPPPAAAARHFAGARCAGGGGSVEGGGRHPRCRGRRRREPEPGWPAAAAGAWWSHRRHRFTGAPSGGAGRSGRIDRAGPACSAPGGDARINLLLAPPRAASPRAALTWDGYAARRRDLRPSYVDDDPRLGPRLGRAHHAGHRRASAQRLVTPPPGHARQPHPQREALTGAWWPGRRRHPLAAREVRSFTPSAPTDPRRRAWCSTARAGADVDFPVPPPRRFGHPDRFPRRRERRRPVRRGRFPTPGGWTSRSGSWWPGCRNGKAGRPALTQGRATVSVRATNGAGLTSLRDVRRVKVVPLAGPARAGRLRVRLLCHRRAATTRACRAPAAAAFRRTTPTVPARARCARASPPPPTRRLCGTPHVTTTTAGQRRATAPTEFRLAARRVAAGGFRRGRHHRRGDLTPTSDQQAASAELVAVGPGGTDAGPRGWW